MNLPRLFKLPEHRQFNYRPFYYNPAKEERDARTRLLKSETGDKPEGDYTPSIQRGAMKSYFKRSEKARKQSNIRLIIIIFFLLLVTYLLLFR